MIMRFEQLPNGDYYLQKGRSHNGDSSFIFLPKWSYNPNSQYGYISFSNLVGVPKELVGKRVRIKIEFVEDK